MPAQKRLDAELGSHTSRPKPQTSIVDYCLGWGRCVKPVTRTVAKTVALIVGRLNQP